MKFYRLLCLLMLFPAFMSAQDTIPKKQYEDIVSRINKPVPGKGSVTLIQDDKIADKLGKPAIKNAITVQANGDAKYLKISGFRIQIFSGNNQRVSKNEAFSKEADLKSVFPELSTYVKYNAPFWRLRVGDFQTYQDAQNMLMQLRRSFPAFGREMSIVREKIQVKVQ